MGWFDAPKYPGVVLGDEPLDETYAFLKHLSRTYEQGLGRKPTCEELQALLETCLRVNADGTLLSGFEELQVSAVQIKTAKRPKRQTYRAGDIFAIPLPSGRFAFGRIMTSGEKLGNLVEVFKETAPVAVATPRILESGRLFHPVYLNGLRAFRDPAYRIINSDPDYAPSDCGSLQFLVGVPGLYELKQGSAKSHRISDAEAAGIEPLATWEHEPLTTRVKRALADR